MLTLGLAYLHAVLEQTGHDVLTLPLNDRPEAEGRFDLVWETVDQASVVMAVG